jgi:hypothetical protein
LNRSHNFWVAGLALAISSWSRADAIIPTASGTSWEYQVTDFQSKSRQPGMMTITIAGTEQLAGKDVLKLETHTAAGLQKTELIAENEEGLLCFRRSTSDGKSISFDPPMRLLPAQLSLGTKWELDEEVAGVEMHQQFNVAAEEDVTVPAGTFHAYRLEAQEPWPLSIAIERWFAPGTGFVKDVTTTRGPTGRLLSRVTTVLKKFTPSPVTVPNEPSTIQPDQPTIVLEVAKARDGEPATDFRSDAANIFVRWKGAHLPLGDTVRVAWVAEDVGDIAPANFIVDQTTTIVDASETGVQFTLSRPKDGWAAGKYRVDLYLDDSLVQSVKVTIVD